jgi:hypothetical protein
MWSCWQVLADLNSCTRKAPLFPYVSMTNGAQRETPIFGGPWSVYMFVGFMLAAAFAPDVWTSFKFRSCLNFGQAYLPWAAPQALPKRLDFFGRCWEQTGTVRGCDLERMRGPNLEGISEKQRWPEEMSLEFRILYADCIYFHLSEIGNFKSSQCWMKWHVSHFPLLWQVANWAFSFLIDSLFSFPCWIPLKLSIYSNNSVMPCAAGPSPGYMGGCGMGGLGMAQMPPPSSMGAALGYVCHCVHAVHWSLDHQYLMNLRGKGNSKTPPFEGWSGWPLQDIVCFVLGLVTVGRCAAMFCPTKLQIDLNWIESLQNW